MKILMVLTSHDELGSTGKKTGFWLEEFAAPFYVFKDAGAEITLASPKGGHPPLDPKSDEKDSQTAATARFKADKEVQNALAHTRILKDLCADDYDALFYPGGHGPLWDLAEDRCSIALIDTMYAQGKPVSAVCHAPGVLRHAKTPDGSPLVQGKQVTGFSSLPCASIPVATACQPPGILSISAVVPWVVRGWSWSRPPPSARMAWPADLPLFVRISATDWVVGGWDMNQSIVLARQLKELGVDLIDCSSGFAVPNEPVPFGPGFQVPFAARVRAEAGIASGAVGYITEPAQAEQIVATGQADVVLLGREMLRDPYWPLHAAKILHADVQWPNQYLRAM